MPCGGRAVRDYRNFKSSLRPVRVTQSAISRRPAPTSGEVKRKRVGVDCENFHEYSRTELFSAPKAAAPNGPDGYCAEVTARAGAFIAGEGARATTLRPT
ncbi:hypothetical protein EVAR_926_1 [Eumeta japonica]|uniref:Uncharacterized protein n=1 Tax=Eumeta variegata TaxID=151549 RepID=A0A4C1SE38_EUMVA|nr:hypothetical protein EVAR_926_1 [Eumeta japonica]